MQPRPGAQRPEYLKKKCLARSASCEVARTRILRLDSHPSTRLASFYLTCILLLDLHPVTRLASFYLTRMEPRPDAHNDQGILKKSVWRETPVVKYQTLASFDSTCILLHLHPSTRLASFYSNRMGPRPGAHNDQSLFKKVSGAKRQL